MCFPSDARETEEDVGQVIATRGEKKSKKRELGCCAGFEWNPTNRHCAESSSYADPYMQ